MNTEHEQAINESGRERLSEGIKWHKGPVTQMSRKFRSHAFTQSFNNWDVKMYQF